MKRKMIRMMVEIPDGAAISEVLDYIRDELRSAGGFRRAEDPLSDGLVVTDIEVMRCPIDAAKKDPKYVQIVGRGKRKP